MLRTVQGKKRAILFFRCKEFVMTLDERARLMDMSGVAWMFSYPASGAYRYLIFLSQDSVENEEGEKAWRSKIEHWCYDHCTLLCDLIDGDEEVIRRYLKSPTCAVPYIALKLTPEGINDMVATVLTQKVGN